MRRAREEIDQIRGRFHGHVAVCLSTVAHIALLPYALPQFRARYPDVHLDLTEGLYPTVEGALRAGIVDCYIGPPPREPPGPELIIEKLFDNTRVILGRRAAMPLTPAGEFFCDMMRRASAHLHPAAGVATARAATTARKAKRR